MSTPIRKTPRTPKPSLKAKEAGYIAALRSSGVVQTCESDESFTDEEVYLKLLENVEKPTVLHEDEVIAGETIFKFQERKTKDRLSQKVAEACNQKTPHALRRKTKTKLAKLIEESSDSDYEPTDKSSSSEDSKHSSSDSEVDQPNKPGTSSKGMLNFEKATFTPLQNRTRSKYVINTEEYFSHSSNKNKTSNNTLDKLETPRLPQYQLQKLLEKMKLSKEHNTAVKRLVKEHSSAFKKWMNLLTENFNLLLYGLGSKRNILRKFQQECLNVMPVLVINGYFPTLTMKNILDTILIDLFELNENPGNPHDACDLIIKEFKKYPNTRLYLIIHNIEGEMIRNAKDQTILAKLVSIDNIHLIASIDHINGPLIWDQNKLSKLNFVWCDVTSFEPYTEETAFERSMMVQQTGALALSSLKNIFLSLTTNSKNIYLIIAKHQLEYSNSQFYQGISFKDLYMTCRYNFIVSSDLALRAQLTEFVDHKMVKMKRSVEGTEYLVIPLADNLLQKFVEENS